MIPTNSQLLTKKELQVIHEASLHILAHIGLEVQNEQALEIFKKHGCILEGDDGSRVKIPETVVGDFLSMIPPKFTYRAQNPLFDRTIPDQAPLVITASSAPNVIDLETQKERKATSKDLAQMAKLVNQLPGIDLFSISVLAFDVPIEDECKVRFQTALKYCQKPIRGSGDDYRGILELAYNWAGGERAYKEHPFITHHYCPIISPLKMDNKSTALMIYYAKHGLPGHPTIVPNGGMTAPFTLAGTLAQGNAEFLALAILKQMVRPETPTVYSVLPTLTDMRSGAYSPGGIECGMLNMAFAQMAAYYNIPSSGYVGLTNSKLVDAQAGLEKAISCMGALLSGMHVLQFVGLIDALMSFDFSMMILDHELSLMLKRVARGMEISRESLALEEIKEVGPSGMFLSTPGTIKRMRDSAFLPQLADRQMRSLWEAQGSLDVSKRAQIMALNLLGKNI